MDCSLPGSSTHGIFQARVLEWGTIDFSRRSSIQLAKTRPGADCGSDHELFIAKFGLKLKKVGKISRPFPRKRNAKRQNGCLRRPFT